MGHEGPCGPGGRTELLPGPLDPQAWPGAGVLIMHSFQFSGRSAFLPGGPVGGEGRGRASGGRASWRTLCPEGSHEGQQVELRIDRSRPMTRKCFLTVATDRVLFTLCLCAWHWHGSRVGPWEVVFE